MNRRAACIVFAFVSVVGTAPSSSAQITDYPVTVPAGRTQFEIDFLHTRDNAAGTRTDSFNASSILITHGLTSRADIGIGFDGYYHDRYKTAGVTTTAHDWGDLTLRAKYSLWGHDKIEHAPGDTAFALLPYVTLPLKAGDYGSDLVLGGLILPLAITLPRDWFLIIMTEFDAIPDTTDRHRKFQWIESFVLERPLSEKTSGYIEFYSILPAERGLDWQAQINLGLYYSFTTDFCLDLGCNFGVTRAAPDAQPFAGLTYVY